MCRGDLYGRPHHGGIASGQGAAQRRSPGFLPFRRVALGIPVKPGGHRGVLPDGLEKGADLLQALVDSELQPSRGQARKTVASNAVTINGEKQADPEYVFSDSDRLFGRYTLLRRGKKNYCLVCWK